MTAATTTTPTGDAMCTPLRPSRWQTRRGHRRRHVCGKHADRLAPHLRRPRGKR